LFIAFPFKRVQHFEDFLLHCGISKSGERVHRLEAGVADELPSTSTTDRPERAEGGGQGVNTRIESIQAEAVHPGAKAVGAVVVVVVDASRIVVMVVAAVALLKGRIEKLLLTQAGLLNSIV